MARKVVDYGSQLPRAGINRRGVLLASGVIFWLIIVIAYAGPAWAVAVYRLIVEGGALALWLIAATGMGAWLLPLFRMAGFEERGQLLRLVTATALGLGVFSLIVLALGLAGWLNQGSAVALITLGLVLGIVRLWRSRLRDGAVRRWLAEPAGWGWFGLIVVPFAAMMTVGAMLPPYVLWTPQEPHGYDVVEYHLQVPREWYELGRIVPLHHNVFSYFPFNVEMHYLLAMHLRGGPWAGMYLAQLMHGAFVVLTVLAVCGFAGYRREDEREGASGKAKGQFSSFIAFLAIATTPWLTQLGAIAYDEGGFLLFGTLAIVWAMLGLRNAEGRIGRSVLAGVMAGLACGAKLTAVPEVLVAVVLVFAAMFLIPPGARRQPLASRALAALVLGIAGTLTFAPWLIRTWAWAGNPVFPELPSLGHGHFSQVQVERWKRAHSAQPNERSVPARLKAGWFEILANWQFGFLLIPAALIAIALYRRDPDVWFLGAMLFLLALFWLGFTHLQGRFFILAAPICAMLIARLPKPVIPVLLVQACVGIAILNVHFLTPARRQAMPVVLGTEDLSWLTPAALQSVPKTEPLVLVGDARAFLYQIPMSRLSYRTVFDADTSDGRGIIEAWAGPKPAQGTQWLLIDPNELLRFEKTYQPFPPVPAEIAAHGEPYVVQR